MKIGHLDPPVAVTPASGERGTASTPKVSSATGEASTQVDLSDTASLLSAGGSAPEFDAEKVTRIAQAIRDGKYKVNAEAIADKLITNAHELLGKVAH